jgi:hypothetical protein
VAYDIRCGPRRPPAQLFRPSAHSLANACRGTDSGLLGGLRGLVQEVARTQAFLNRIDRLAQFRASFFDLDANSLGGGRRRWRAPGVRSLAQRYFVWVLSHCASSLSVSIV